MGFGIREILLGN